MPKSAPAFLIGLLSIVLLTTAPVRAQYVQEDTVKKAPVQKQEEPKPTFWQRISPGGNFGASFGTVTYLEASPMVTYAFTDKFFAGPGITYIYSSIKYSNTDRVSSSIYGGRVLGRYIIYKNFFAHAEVESLNLPAYRLNSSGTAVEEVGRAWVVSPLVGGGARLPLGRRSAMYVTALYNLNYDQYKSPYASPIILRIGLSL